MQTKEWKTQKPWENIRINKQKKKNCQYRTSALYPTLVRCTTSLHKPPENHQWLARSAETCSSGQPHVKLGLAKQKNRICICVENCTLVQKQRKTGWKPSPASHTFPLIAQTIIWHCENVSNLLHFTIERALCIPPWIKMCHMNIGGNSPMNNPPQQIPRPLR